MTERPNRINVVGTSGSGKSTFAKDLAARLGYPYVEMDQIFWKPNWQWSEDAEFFARLKTALAQPNWVLDGNYTRTVPIKWDRVDQVIWLDLSFARTLTQAISRALRRAWTKQELWAGTGNRESFRRSFLSKHSIIWWTITTHAENRRSYERYMNDPRYSRIQFVRLRSRRETESYLRELPARRPS